MKLHILYLSSSKNIGITHHISRLLLELKKNNARFISLSTPQEQEQNTIADLRAKGIQCLFDPFMDSIDVLSVWRSACIIKDIVITHNVEIIHVQGIAQLFRATLAKLMLRSSYKHVKIIYTVHLFPNIVLWKMIKLCADHLIAPSKIVGDYAKKVGIPSNKIHIVYNWIDLAKFDECRSTIASVGILFPIMTTNHKRIIYIANFYPWKNHRCLMDAFKIVVTLFPNTDLILLGEGPLKNELVSYTHKLRLQHNVHFLGRLPYKFVPSLLSQSDIAIVFSKVETFCTALVEAMAAFKPVISTPVGIAPEIIHNNKNGILVPMNDCAILAEKICYLLKEDSLRKQMGCSARATIERRLTVDVSAKDLINLYNNIMTHL